MVGLAAVKLKRSIRMPDKGGAGWPPKPLAPTVGCICPPTSEQTCKRPDCPRQDRRSLRERLKAANP